MSVTELKERLHKKIEEITNQSFLEEILSLVNANWSDSLSEEEVSILEERHARYLNGQEKEIPIEEFNAQMRKKYGL